MNAIRFDAATMKSMWVESHGSNLIGFGHLFGPDQNGAPDDVIYKD